MAGEDQLDTLTDQIGLLLGETVGADQKVALRSVHRAALISWARKRALTLAPALIGSSAGFTPRALLSGDAPVSTPPAEARTEFAAHAGATGFGGVGIDMEDVSALPAADDFREHPFYQDNFTPREIAYCLMQPDVAASFCGIWAAKEAILKSGRVGLHQERLCDIEIMRDGLGRPSFAGCALSISHTPTAAVAICMVSTLQASLVTAKPAPPPLVSPPTPGVEASTRPALRLMATFASLVLGALLGGGVVFLAGHF